MARTNPKVWRRFLMDRGIAADLATFWAGFARPNILLIGGPVCYLDITAIGTSKLGGYPDLPDGMAWPVRPAFAYRQDSQRATYLPDSAWRPQPLSFMGQINLSEVAKFGCDLPLPHTGVLSFFYDAVTQPWGFDPNDAVGTQVMYLDGRSSLRRVAHPDGQSLKVRAINPLPSECLPGWEWINERLAEKPGYNRNAFFEEIKKLNEDDSDLMTHGGHSFSGWPRIIQSPMELECQLASHGIYCGDPEGYADPRVPQLSPGAADWRLLLQLNTDDELGWTWGDVGRVYFWCRKQDIGEHQFGRSWTILQCY
jgi:uncharacterized protein YwqG